MGQNRPPITYQDVCLRAKRLCKTHCLPSDASQDLTHETILLGLEKALTGQDLYRWVMMSMPFLVLSGLRKDKVNKRGAQEWHTGYQLTPRSCYENKDEDWKQKYKAKQSKGMVSRWASKAKITSGSLRELRGSVTQAYIAGKLGVSVRTYGNWEKGRCTEAQEKQARAILVTFLA